MKYFNFLTSCISAILAAAFPDEVPFMADESMLSTPGIEATDYTLAEYLNYAEHIKACAERLKKLGMFYGKLSIKMTLGFCSLMHYL